MKRSIVAALLAVSIFLAGCKSSGTVKGKEYEAYGLANEDARKDPTLKYEISAWNVVVGCIFFETVFVPVYVVGWDLYVPVGSVQ